MYAPMVESSSVPLRMMMAFPITGGMIHSSSEDAVGPMGFPDRFATTEQTPSTAASANSIIPNVSLKIQSLRLSGPVFSVTPAGG